jgi:hypothetical protein
MKPLLLALTLFILAGCASPSGDRAPAVSLTDVTPFSSAYVGAKPPGGWRPWVLSRFKRPTDYALVTKDGALVVRAQADRSASGLIHPLANLDPLKHSELSWRWKVESLLKGADNTLARAEDSPVRMIVTFAGDMSKLDFGERMFFSKIKAVTGEEMPYATMMYIWENKQPVGSVIPNNHTERIKMVVAGSGADGVGAWQIVTRNIVDDYKRAFGEDPGPITAIGIMTDTDNTGEQTQAWYGDIKLFSK